jgi:hypothetical protein
MPLLSGVVGAQALIMGVNAMSGFLALWTLPRETSYAWFTVASSMLTMIVLLSDAGISVATNAIGGQVWQDRLKFSHVIAAVSRHQRRLTGIALALTLPWITILMVRVNAPLWSIAGLAIAGALIAWPMATAQILANVNRLHSRYRPQLFAEIANAVTRLALTAACLLPVFFTFGGIKSGSLPESYPINYCFIGVMLAACLSNLVYYLLVRLQSGQILLPGIPASSDYDADIRQKVRHMYPFTIFNCLQGQLSVGLISLFGASAQVADMGALGRLIVIFGLAGAPLVQIAIPSFARSKDRRQLLAQFRKVCALYALFATGILGLAVLLPTPILWLLGPQYSHLSNELRFTVLGMIVNGYSTITWGLLMARGWVQSMTLVIPVGIAAQIAGLCLFDLSSVSGVLGFNIFTSVPPMLLACFIIWRGFGCWQTPES